jgi:hypothetical protein
LKEVERGKKMNVHNQPLVRIKEKKILMNDEQPRLDDDDKHIIGAR